jgi:hypothetical protein
VPGQSCLVARNLWAGACLIDEHCRVAVRVIDAFLEEEADGHRINLYKGSRALRAGKRVPVLTACCTEDVLHTLCAIRRFQ